MQENAEAKDNIFVKFKMWAGSKKIISLRITDVGTKQKITSLWGPWPPQHISYRRGNNKLIGASSHHRRRHEATDNIPIEDCKCCVLEFRGAEISVRNQYLSLNSTGAALAKYWTSWRLKRKMIAQLQQDSDMANRLNNASSYAQDKQRRDSW